MPGSRISSAPLPGSSKHDRRALWLRVLAVYIETGFFFVPSGTQFLDDANLLGKLVRRPFDGQIEQIRKAQNEGVQKAPIRDIPEMKWWELAENSRGRIVHQVQRVAPSSGHSERYVWLPVGTVLNFFSDPEIRKDSK